MVFICNFSPWMAYDSIVAEVFYNLKEKTHKAGRAALGLSCVACFEQPNPVYFGCGASY